MTGSDVDSEVRQRLAGLKARIDSAARRSGRDPDDVTLVGVCKGQPIERIVAAARAGVCHLAENYVQEARDRRDEIERLVSEQPPSQPLHWHFIGSLQRNKARAAAQLFEWVESVDSEKLAVELDRRAQAAERELSLCLQVNLSGEPQKGGVAEEAVAALLAACDALGHVTVRGLMAVPAPDPDPEAVRPSFVRLRELRDRLRRAPGGSKLEALSMGMSGDFETAIEEGATIVRIGTALFGERGARA